MQSFNKVVSLKEPVKEAQPKLNQLQLDQLSKSIIFSTNFLQRSQYSGIGFDMETATNFIKDTLANNDSPGDNLRAPFLQNAISRFAAAQSIYGSPEELRSSLTMAVYAILNHELKGFENRPFGHDQTKNINSLITALWDGISTNTKEKEREAAQAILLDIVNHTNRLIEVSGGICILNKEAEKMNFNLVINAIPAGFERDFARTLAKAETSSAQLRILISMTETARKLSWNLADESGVEKYKNYLMVMKNTIVNLSQQPAGSPLISNDAAIFGTRYIQALENLNTYSKPINHTPEFLSEMFDLTRRPEISGMNSHQISTYIAEQEAILRSPAGKPLDTKTLPETVTGKMYAMGGKVTEINLNMLGRTENEKIFNAAAALGRLSNYNSETIFHLNLDADLIEKIQAQFIQNKEASDNRGLVGVRADDPIKILSTRTNESLKPDYVHKREIDPALINADATKSIIISGGGTHLRIDLIDNTGERIASEKLPTKLTELLKSNRLEQEFNKLLIEPADRPIIQAIIERIQNNFDSNKPQYNGISNQDIAILEKLQLRRLDDAITKLLASSQTEIKDIKGTAFTIAGNIDMANGSINSPGVEGFQNTEIAQHYEKFSGRPVVLLNDVDCETAAIAGKIIAIDKLIQVGTFNSTDQKELQLAAIAQSIKNGESQTVTGIGGGTGTGGSQILLFRSMDGDLKLEVQLGRFGSTMELGHNVFDQRIPEFKKVIDTLKAEKVPETFIREFLAEQGENICKWCGNKMDFELLAGGVGLDNIGKWIYERLSESDKTMMNAIIAKRKENQAITIWDEEQYKTSIKAADLIEFAKMDHESKDIDYTLQFMAKLWAAHMVLISNDAKMLIVEGKPQTWNTFLLTQGMFREGNEFFINLVKESLAKDFPESKLNVVFMHNDNNQTQGAGPILISEIEAASPK